MRFLLIKDLTLKTLIISFLLKKNRKGRRAKTMANHLMQKKKLSNMSMFLGLVVIVLALTVPAVAQECKVSGLDVPDPSTLNLVKDGEHVIASADTVAGKLEARVTVKNKVVSSPWVFLDGRPLKKITEAEIPKEVLLCMKTAESPSGSWLANAASSAVDWMVPKAYAACSWHFKYSISKALNGKYYVVCIACDCHGNCGIGSN